MSGPSGRPRRPGSASRPGQRVRHLRRPRGAGDLLSARPGTDRRAAAQLAGDPAAPRSPRSIRPLATATRSPSGRPSSPLTQVLGWPVTGRAFFEHVIRDNLDTGRPDEVAPTFNRKLMWT